MSTINNVILVGFVGGDPEIKETTSGQQIARFSVATSTYKGVERGEVTEWHKIVCFGGVARAVSKFVRTGQRVGIVGSIEYWSKEDAEGRKVWRTSIVASDVRFLSTTSDARGES